MTKIQGAIFDTISRTGNHLTAEQVFATVKGEYPSVSLSTVYRNLNIFAQAGKIRRIQRATGQDYYERNLTPHDHAYCIHCGKVSDLKIGDLKEYLQRHFEHPISSFDLTVNYVCPECKDTP